MAADPNRGRNLTIVVIAGLAIGVLVIALLVANADELRELRDGMGEIERVGTQYV